MSKKSLEQYQKEFEEFTSPIGEDGKWLSDVVDNYEILANECILDFPEEKLGYKKLGMAFINTWYSGKYDIYQKVIEIFELSVKNNRYITTLEGIFENKFSDPLLPRVIKLPDNDKNFAKLWLLLGIWELDFNEFDAANYNFEIANKLGVNYREFINIQNPHISAMSISNFVCIENLKIDITGKKEIYFLGENGVGKTLLLQAIILDFIREEFQENPYALFRDKNANNSHSIFIVLNKPLNVFHRKIKYLNLFAYGTGRFRESDANIDEYGYSTLFDRNKLLKNPINWFKDVLLRETLKESPLTIKTVLRFFEEIINFDDKNDFKIERIGSEFNFYEQGTLTEFKHLAEGYRSVLIWLSDLLSRLTKNQPYIKRLEDFYGIVLVDEIDMFLHPKWERKIVNKLRKKLPNIQWFFTTHSPMLILGASKDAIIYKIYKEDGKTNISEPYKQNDFTDYLLNGVVTSPLFDLDTATLSNATKSKLYTSDFLYEEIHQKVKARLKNKPEQIKTIQNLIDEVLDELELEGKV